jgi:hypothetical protein
MSVRRWIAVAGMSLAVAGASAATVRTAAKTEYEAQVKLGMPGPPPVEADRIQVLKGPQVRESVRLRLGDVPPLRIATAAGDILVRSRGASACEAVEATRAYAESYVELRRRQAASDRDAAVEAIGRKLDELETQVASATEPQRSSLVDVRMLFLQRLDQLQGDLEAEPGELTPAEPVADGARAAWVLAVVGAAVGLGAAASGRRASG